MRRYLKTPPALLKPSAGARDDADFLRDSRDVYARFTLRRIVCVTDRWIGRAPAVPDDSSMKSVATGGMTEPEMDDDRGLFQNRGGAVKK